jgi:hypothetical protein
MIPIFQTEFGLENGNCLSAALASLFECTIDKVPNFSKYKNFYTEFYKWLEINNLAIINTSIKPKGYHLITVKSIRSDKCYHCLVGLNGEPIHDPYPDGNCEHKGIVEYNVLYPIDVSKPVRIS